METRLSRYIKMVSDLSNGPSTSLLIFRSFDPAEAEKLDNQGLFPSKKRIREIASRAGCPEDEVINILKGYVYKFSEGVHILPKEK